MPAQMLMLGAGKRFAVKSALSFFSGDRIGKRLYEPRRITAIIGSFAILVQAMLFAWHHHPLPFSPRGAPAVAVAQTGPELPALADHDCQICLALSHYGAVPVDFFTARPPEDVPLHHARMAAVDSPPAPYLLFRSRAPPRA
jgi:hypothetical protein